MNIQQLEYILAVEEHKHFGRAAEACYVTQPTLSAMILKLEEELGISLFDRSKQPVHVTEDGKKILDQARKIIHEVYLLKSFAAEAQDELSGTLRIGIIPTLAPYLLPLFLRSFSLGNPRLHLKIQELTTDQILNLLERDQLDAGLLATPAGREGYRESPLFYERFLVYAGDMGVIPDKEFLLAEDLDLENLWLLEEGHCLRDQVVKLCELKKKKTPESSLEYASGSIESLVRMVDAYSGITVLPELAVGNWSEEKKKRLRRFAEPVPEREISLVTWRHENKKRALAALKASILRQLPETASRQKSGRVLPI